MKERGTEIMIFIVGGIGLLILFALMYSAPSFVFQKIVGLINNVLR